MFKPVTPKVDFPKLEEEILAYWKKNKIFEKSVEMRSENKKWTLLDGPPFVTGVPHYGTLLSSIPKDVFGRYWTMKGYRVRRVWGWDGHGLPIENKVEGKLDIKRKIDIEEKIGVGKFVEECRKYVDDVSGEWKWYIDHIGRWVDFENAYKTWDRDYMESVMWVFKQIYDKGYIYKGLRVTLYCPHCATPISNFEVAMDSDNYKEISDSATVYKYKLENEKNTYILAWSTTPWNKIVTSALAVNPKLEYVKVKQQNEFYILAKSTLKILRKDPYEIVEELKGKDLVGEKFEPHYDYYKKNSKGKLFEIIGGSFVTADEGTGVVTIAAYGEEDLMVMQEKKVHIEMHLDEEGTVFRDVPKFGGMYYLKANKAVNDDLEKRGLIYSNKDENRKVALCWRCHTRLYYAPITAWYVDIQKLKPLLKKTNENVNWFPKHFKNGRFLKSLESAPDWNISRNRYWGSPVPVWECDCRERFVPGSIRELERASGKKIGDLHKPFIDEIKITCHKCNKKVKRVSEVLDSWIEAGSASFAERHFPFENKEKIEDFFPPDFIAEYTGQIRAWFYVLHVIGGILYESKAFKNVVVEGVILGTDGRKMSKNYGNYPDPKELLKTYGGDALRLYLMGSPVMHGEDILISEEQYRNQVKGMMLVLWNIYNFFISYSNSDKWIVKKNSKSRSVNVLDGWILSLLAKLTKEVRDSLDKYNTVKAIASLNIFVSDLSTWYIRRSRERVRLRAENINDRNATYETLWHVLLELSKLMAPLTPFLSEEIYRNLTNLESVHLEDFPISKKEDIDKELENEMNLARKIVELVHSQRKESRIKVRQPLGKFKVQNLKSKIRNEIIEIIKDEVNIKSVEIEEGNGQLKIVLDVKITQDLQDEGRARDIARMIQGERKKLGVRLDEKIDVTLSSWPEEFEEYIKKRALIENMRKGSELKIERK